MKLFLLRHGAAVDASVVGGSDEARMLTDAGRERTMRAAEVFREMGVAVDRVISSPLPRALETAELTAKALEVGEKVRRDDRLKPGASPETLLMAVADLKGDPENVMLVGHNPDLEELLSWLVGPEGQSHLLLKKGSLAIVRLNGGAKDFKRKGCGELLGLYPAKALERLAH
jgi:phosphohistidine phosphatase